MGIKEKIIDNFFGGKYPLFFMTLLAFQKVTFLRESFPFSLIHQE
jgi:hypothetical protein